MAGWISSKLKVAENILQQIDQQAAESLGATERKQLNGLDFNDTSPKSIGSVSLREQLKKKAPESDEAFGKFGSGHTNSIRTSTVSRDVNSNRRQQLGKGVAEPDLNSNSYVLNDGDWTELLSTPKRHNPKQQTSTSTGRANGLLGERGVKKFGGKRVSVGLNVKGHGKSVGTVVKASDGNYGKADSGVGDGTRDELESRNSHRVSVLGSDHTTPEELKSGRDLKNSGGLEGKKAVDHVKDTTGNGDEQRNSEKLVVDTGSSFLPRKPDVLSGSNRDVLARVCNKSKEALDDDEKIRTLLTEDNNDVHIAHRVAGDLKCSSYSEGNNISDSDSESSSTSDSGSEVEREREARIQRRRQILAAKAAEKAAGAIKEQENLVARLEGEKQILEKIVEEQANQAAYEASALQSTMIETMEAAELEKQKHNHTRMEVLARLAKLETSNADLAKALATAQWNLELEVNRVVELRRQMEVKEVVHEEHRRKICSTSQTKNTLTHFMLSKGIEFEKEMSEAEYSSLTDKVDGLQEKAAKLEANIDLAQKEMGNTTEVEVELKQRLRLMTDHLIQKQAQVEALCSERAMILFRLEAVSRLLDENKSLISAGDLSGSSMDDVEVGTWKPSGSKLQPMFEDKIQSGKQHLGSLLRQLDAIFSAGAVFLARNPAAKLSSLVYLASLHLWVLYILFSHSRSAEDDTSSAVLSLGNINSNSNNNV